MSTPEPDPITPTEKDHEEEAAAEAAAIGGTGTSEADPAQQAVREAGGGESEGFEDAEQALVENASHGDQHAAHRVLQDVPDPEPEQEAAEHGEPDREEDDAA